ncbi:zinc ribbon domain-containing protein [Vagococcus fluvialis]|uniref:zinc ribbon domain-containing protein n=1 Tax=Vagococcus fluvialis TaxID=2738 RepID=UPI003B5A99CD
MNKCNNCGHLNPKDGKFCEECGSSLLEVSVSLPSDCPSCGAVNDSGAKFCESCGHNLQNKTDIQSKVESVKELCSECGTERVGEGLFCEECGQSFSEIQQEESSLKKQNNIEPQLIPTVDYQGDSIQEIPEKTPKKKMSLKNKIIISLLLIVIIGAGGAYKFFDNKYSKDNQIKDLITAINRNDASFVSKHMTSDDPSLKLSKEIVQPMLAYFEENKDAVNKLSQAFDKNESYIGLEVKEQGKKAFLFPEYKIDVNPVYTTVTSNSKNSKIEMNGQELFTTDSNEFERKIGPLVPGVYKFKASIKDQKETVETTHNLLPVSEATDEQKNVDMSFIKVNIPISSNMKDSIIYINDKEVGTVGDEQTTIGPLLWEDNMTVHLVKKTDSGEIKTEPQTVKKEDLYEEGNGVSTAPSLRFKFDVASSRDVERGLTLFYDDFSKVVSASSDYNASEFASRYYENGDKNKAFSGINEYITWCRDRSAKKEYEGVRFSINVASVDPVSDDTYKIKYNVEYRTTYPYATRKSMRIEGFDYSNVTIKLQMDEDNYKVKSFQFVDMGDGGKKVKDNGANE